MCYFCCFFDYVTWLSLCHHNKWKSAWYSLGSSLADNLIAISSPDALFLLVLWSLIKYWGELVKGVEVAFLNWKTNAIRNTIELIMHAKSLAVLLIWANKKKYFGFACCQVFCYLHYTLYKLQWWCEVCVESGQGQVKLSVVRQIFNPVVGILCQSGQRPVICPHPESILIPIRGSCLHINPATIRWQRAVFFRW